MWHAFARQLSNPSGLAGRIVGRMMRVANRQPTRLAIEALDIRPGEDMLDLGCGPGQAAALMLPLARPGRVCGIDQSPVMIDQARQLNRDAIRTGDAAFAVAGFDALPYPDASFDGVLASNVMYFWHDTAPVLAEIRRVLRPGGRLSIYLTSAETMSSWKLAGAGTHRLFMPDQVLAALVEAGFATGDIHVRSVAIEGGVTGIVALARNGKRVRDVAQAA
jgi:ubiquinone/menaquinone biosynthesis C-methylase UbiE